MILKIKHIATIFLLALPALVFSQQSVEPALQVLAFAPDARAAGMGDAGVATAADINSQHWNAAKYIFATQNGGVGLSYTPWLRDVNSDINITYLSGFYKFQNNQSLSLSLRFFSLGNIDIYTKDAQFLQTMQPSEFAIDAAYSRQLGKYCAGAVSFRYINSSKIVVENFNSVISKISNIAADIAFYYQKPVIIFEKNAEFAVGASISNLGTKLKLSDSSSYFLPMCLRLGARATVNINNENSVSATVELNKSLVPSDYEYRNSTVMDAAARGMFSNFSQMIYIVGAEYSYKKTFAFRAGYHRESKKFADNSYITFGFGIRYNNLHLDASYLFVTSNQKTAMNNTYRISAAWMF
jgi:hypothetical protein